ncbi:SPOR domain-containing protein [Alteraurantiacibacter palmitatis]|uniref:SPOR domain-containing protein n=1 Tax=Alteraurantiacibacter palmitatis TaxID=2054628 RepID=A0ABV7E4U2_9SPHN
MRFQGDSKAGRIARVCVILASTTALAACGALGGGGPATGLLAASSLPGNGPQADFPVTIGEPYQIGSVTYRPADVLNYDEVGYVTAGNGRGYTGAHHTLPFPAYVEVTSLETGRTILIRLEARGPMETHHLLSLSPAAMEQLGASENTPVRVRRVNAPEMHRALLRDGQPAPMRMDTPMGLVEVLRRRLPAEGSASLALTPVVAPQVASTVEASSDFAAAFTPPVANEMPPPPLAPPAAATPAPLPAAPVSAPRPPAASGFAVQAATFSTRERAARVAEALGGQVVPFGNLFRVRTGPFATRSEAEASLANVRRAGYSDARILTDGQG